MNGVQWNSLTSGAYSYKSIGATGAKYLAECVAVG